MVSLADRLPRTPGDAASFRDSRGAGAPPRAGAADRALRVVPWLLVVLALLGLVRRAATPLSNPDTFFHLAFGRRFLDEWSLRDPGSVTPLATESWLPTQWASQVAFAWLEDVAGLGGVAWLYGVSLIAYALALFLTARAFTPPLAAAPVMLLLLVCSGLGLSARPQVWSYVLAAVVTWAWLATSRDHRVRWWLVPLTWCWVLVHGMWPLALVIGAVACAGLVADRAPRRTVLHGCAIVAASAAAATLTPLGTGAWTAVAGVGSRRAFFPEWGPPSYADPRMLLLLALVAGTALLLARPSRTQRDWTSLLLLLLAAAWAVYTARTAPVAAAMLAPLLGIAVGASAPGAPPRRREVAAALAAGLAACTALAVLVSVSDVRPVEPRWVGTALDELPAGTVVVANRPWGSYLVHSHPELVQVAHGYGDAFTVAELRRNRDLLEGRPGWDRLLAETGATWALLPPDSPLAYDLERFAGWTPVRDDGEIALYRRD